MPRKRTNESVQGQYFRWLISIRQGTYYADGRSNPQKLKRYSLGVSTRSEALEVLKQLDLKMAVEHGLAERSLLIPEAQGISLAEGSQKYMDDVRGKRAMGNISRKTPKRYQAVFDKFSRFCLTLKLSSWRQVTRQVLTKYAEWLEKQGYAYATRYLELNTLKQVNKFLIAEKDLPESCKILLKLQKADESDTYCFTGAEMAAILTHCQQTPELRWFRPVLFTLAHTGMRISELASLRWTDVDLEKQVISLTDERHSAARKRAGEARELKGKRSRSFPIHPGLKPVLEAIPHADDGRVFHGPRGARLKPDRVRRLLIRKILTPLASQFPTPAGEVRGFANGRIHSFRHFFCSVCANSRVPEQTLMSWLGHRNSRMIRRYYHLHDEASQQAMQSVQFVPSPLNESSV